MSREFTLTDELGTSEAACNSGGRDAIGHPVGLNNWLCLNMVNVLPMRKVRMGNKTAVWWLTIWKTKLMSGRLVVVSDIT